MTRFNIRRCRSGNHHLVRFFCEHIHSRDHIKSCVDTLQQILPMPCLEIPHRRGEILVSQPNLQRADIGPRPQLVCCIRCPKFMQKPALTVRTDAAVTILFAATRPAIKPRTPRNAFQAFKEMVADTTGLAREYPRAVDISRVPQPPETTLFPYTTLCL